MKKFAETIRKVAAGGQDITPGEMRTRLLCLTAMVVGGIASLVSRYLLVDDDVAQIGRSVCIFGLVAWQLSILTWKWNLRRPPRPADSPGEEKKTAP